MIPFLWSRSSADVIDLTLQRLLTTQMYSPTMSYLPPEAKMHLKIVLASPLKHS